jgi:hypothetical protein
VKLSMKPETEGWNPARHAIGGCEPLEQTSAISNDILAPI